MHEHQEYQNSPNDAIALRVGALLGEVLRLVGSMSAPPRKPIRALVRIGTMTGVRKAEIIQAAALALLDSHDVVTTRQVAEVVTEIPDEEFGTAGKVNYVSRSLMNCPALAARRGIGWSRIKNPPGGAA